MARDFVRWTGATEAVKAAFPEWYRFDPTPVPKTLWRVGADCVAVEAAHDGWYYTPGQAEAAS